MNYKLLLWKYIEHVGQCEGSFFDPGGYHKGWSKVEFSEEELTAFAELAGKDEPPKGD